MNAKQKLAGAIGAGILMTGAVFLLKPKEAQASPHNAPSVSLIQAVNTVLAANPGRAAVDATLERENNILAWEVELDDDREVYVNASTNQIIRTEQHWDLADIPLIGELLPN